MHMQGIFRAGRIGCPQTLTALRQLQIVIVSAAVGGSGDGCAVFLPMAAGFNR